MQQHPIAPSLLHNISSMSTRKNGFSLMGGGPAMCSRAKTLAQSQHRGSYQYWQGRGARTDGSGWKEETNRHVWSSPF